MNFGKYVSRWLTNHTEQDKKLIKAVKQIVGVAPYNIKLYSLAMKHSSISVENEEGFKESNERLEYLGDAILGAVVAEYLFKRFPFKDEGFLTEIRSRIVNRESLNGLAVKIGLSQLVEFEGRSRTPQSHKSIYGDAMEAFIGALYLDRGFKFCKRYIIQKILMNHFDIDQIITTNTNYKSIIIEWAQKNNTEISFSLLEKGGPKRNKQFRIKLEVGENTVAEGNGFSKKKAEQDAARKACESLGVS